MAVTYTIWHQIDKITQYIVMKAVLSRGNIYDYAGAAGKKYKKNSPSHTVNSSQSKYVNSVRGGIKGGEYSVPS